MAKKDLVVDEPKNTALAIASDFEADAGRGFEEMSQEDFALPFLKALTGTSPEVGEVEGATPGMIYNTVTGELFDGKKGITVIPCAYIRQYIEWEPRGSGKGAPVAIYPSTSDILSKTHREPGNSKDFLDNGNYVETSANHYVLVVSEDGVPSPALVVMKSTQLKKSRKWNSMMQSVKLQGLNGLFTPPMYSQMYRITTVPESNDKGKWFGWEVERIGTVESAPLFQAARAFAVSVTSGQIRGKVEAEADEAGTNEAAPF